MIVLLGGLGTTRAMWDPQLAAFPAHALELPGHGDAPLAGPVSVATIGGRVLDAVPGRFSFCGLSLGGMVGMWLAANAPERVTRLALACTGAKLGSPDVFRERATLVRREGVGVVVEGARERWFTPAFRDSPDAKRVIDALRGVSPEGYAACCEAVGDFDFRAELHRIVAPTLVVVGREDPVTPAESVDTLVGGIPGARGVHIRGAHLANVEAPDEFNAAVLDHLRSDE